MFDRTVLGRSLVGIALYVLAGAAFLIAVAPVLRGGGVPDLDPVFLAISVVLFAAAGYANYRARRSAGLRGPRYP